MKGVRESGENAGVRRRDEYLLASCQVFYCSIDTVLGCTGESASGREKSELRERLIENLRLEQCFEGSEEGISALRERAGCEKVRQMRRN